jgi:hypothetical protein
MQKKEHELFLFGIHELAGWAQIRDSAAFGPAAFSASTSVSGVVNMAAAEEMNISLVQLRRMRPALSDHVKD